MVRTRKQTSRAQCHISFAPEPVFMRPTTSGRQKILPKVVSVRELISMIVFYAVGCSRTNESYISDCRMIPSALDGFQEQTQGCSIVSIKASGIPARSEKISSRRYRL